MAELEQVKQYIAQWSQLGKRVVLRDGQRINPVPIFDGSHYSALFEAYWQKILIEEKGDCYLEGTYETIQELLTPLWELLPCPRCLLPIPLHQLALNNISCPCSDLHLHPNLDLPTPRIPIDSIEHLQQLKHRLDRVEPLLCPNTFLIAQKRT